MAVQSRTAGLIAAGLFLMASPSWAQYYDNRAPNTTVYTSPALGGGQGGYGGGYGAPAAESAPLPADAAGRVEVRLQALEEQIRRLTGRLEEAQHQVGVLKDRLERMQADVDLRFKEMATAQPAPEPARPGPSASAGGGGVLGTLPQGDAKPAPSKGLPAGSPKEQYEYAFRLVAEDPIAAEAALKEFLAKHPKDNLAGNAQFWLGEIHYSRKEYQQAALAYLTVHREYPKNAKAADSMLKLAMSLAGLGKTKDACTALAKFNQDYPTAADALKRRANSERNRLGCG